MFFQATLNDSPSHNKKLAQQSPSSTVRNAGNEN
jgi:hypothetical protein